MSTIIVTGGAGFIGSCFVRMAIATGKDNIVTLDKLTYAGCMDSLADATNSPRHTFIEGDIGDSSLVEEILQKYRPTAIVNFAAESHVDRSIDGPADFVETNVVGTFRLLDACLRYWSGLPNDRRDAFRFLQISTDEVYGSLGIEGRFTEETTYAPNSPYSASKAAADHFARAYHQTYGLPVLITNSSNNYGPYQLPEKLVPLMILAAAAGREMPVYGNGTNVRDWLFVEDHCRAIRTVLKSGRPGEVYNVGGDSERMNLAVVTTICQTVDRLLPGLPHGPCSGLIKFVADRPGHDQRYAVDAEKIRRQLGWRPRENFESGLEKTVRWYLDNPQWIKAVTARSPRSVAPGQCRLGLGAKQSD